MVGVVDLDDEVGERQLQLVDPELAGSVPRREVQLRPEVQQDVRRLPDEEAARLQERRRERRPRDVVALEESRQRRDAAALLFRDQRDVAVVRARLLELSCPR